MRLLRPRSVLVLALALATLVVGATWANASPSPRQAAGTAPAGAAPGRPPRVAFTMTVAGLTDGVDSDLPLKYTPVEKELSPPITWANPPANTASFVLIMSDMEGVQNHTTEENCHWVVWNIPGTETGLPEAIPAGAQLPDGAFQVSVTGLVYRGPGRATNPIKHHYSFELYAVDKMIDVPGGAGGPKDAFDTRKKVIDAIQGHVLGKAMVITLFRRPQ